MMDIDTAKMRVAELQVAIEKDLPNYVILLSQMHKEFREQPELMYKLGDEAIAIIISGLGRHMKVEITDVKDKKPISAKRGASMSEDDV